MDLSNNGEIPRILVSMMNIMIEHLCWGVPLGTMLSDKAIRRSSMLSDEPQQLHRLYDQA